MHILLTSRWVGLMSCCEPPCNKNVGLHTASVKCFPQCCALFSPWLSAMCITSLHLSCCKHFMFLSPLVISISGICLMAWDSLVNRSSDEEPISTQSLDYVFREPCISIQQYALSACVELRWRLWAFNKTLIKNDAGRSAEGRAAKSQLFKSTPALACLPIMKTLLCLVIEFYDCT